jgi:hypothetical protein
VEVATKIENCETLVSQLVVVDESSVKVKIELRRVNSFTQAYEEVEEKIGDHIEYEHAIRRTPDTERDEGMSP